MDDAPYGNKTSNCLAQLFKNRSSSEKQFIRKGTKSNFKNCYIQWKIQIEQSEKRSGNKPSLVQASYEQKFKQRDRLLSLIQHCIKTERSKWLTGILTYIFNQNFHKFSHCSFFCHCLKYFGKIANKKVVFSRALREVAYSVSHDI